MKKNISINIGGIIFHIEENGYEKLKNYLDSINQYFSSFEDSKEILADIENRIAEIFLGKLSDSNQVISMENVEELIATMGTTTDFKASIEAEEPELDQTKSESSESAQEKEDAKDQPKSTTKTGAKRLYRDTRRRVLGGVASGMAHYFGIDPLWIRLLILALFLNVLIIPASGVTLIAYIIFWIVLPPNDNLEEDKNIKKLYRNSEERVLGGVASGIASYFGADPVVIRVLFVISIFIGGAGLIVYLILWIITPEAKSLTQKMQMQGEPVTLSNIEMNVKKRLKVSDQEESLLVKILLFPFRLIAIIISGLGDILGPLLKFLVEAIRILFGVLLIIIGLSFIFSFIVLLFVIAGWISPWTHIIHFGNIPVDLLANSMSIWALISVFLISFIPSLAITLLGFVVLLKRRVGNAYLGWSMFALWIAGLIGASIFIPAITNDFWVESEYREQREYSVEESIPTLKINEFDKFGDYDFVNLRLRGHSDSTYKLVLNIDSRGSNRSDARENAKAVVYNVIQDGDDFVFDESITFSDKTPFRFQTIDAYFYIPFGKTFRMDDNLADILTNTLHLNGYRSYQMDGNDWMFDKSGINCLTCSNGRKQKDDDDDQPSRRDSKPSYSWSDGEKMQYNFEDFTEVKISTMFKVNIERSSQYKVEVIGDKRLIDDVYLSKRGDRIEIKYEDGDFEWWDKRNRDKDITIFITMPDITSLELIGGCEGVLTGFKTDEMEISLIGASTLTADIDPEYLDVNLAGASVLWLEGTAERLDIKAVGASRVKSLDFKAEYAEVDAVGASSVTVYADKELDISASGASTVKYRGTNNVRADESGFSTIKRY